MTQVYDYFLVSSFEFTCDRKSPVEPQEVIEFCVYKFCVKSQSVLNKFHSYVKPQHPVNAKLSAFCKMLTSIDETQLAPAPDLKEVLLEFDIWMWKQGLHQSRFIFVPHSHFDLQFMLPQQCRVMGYHCPGYFCTWLHLAEINKSFMKKPSVSKRPAKKLIRRMSSQNMLSSFGVKQEGSPHCAIDNCTNTANLIKSMIERGADFSGAQVMQLHTATSAELEEKDVEDILSGRSTPLHFFNIN